jgi:chaperone required for assembly of F1-ATPase
MEQPQEKISRQVSPQWDWLMRTIEAEGIEYGEAKILLHHGQPVEIVEAIKKKRYIS